MEDFLFPASSELLRHRVGAAPINPSAVKPICDSPFTISAVFDLLTALCHNCVPNMRLVAEMLSEMFYNQGQ